MDFFGRGDWDFHMRNRMLAIATSSKAIQAAKAVLIPGRLSVQQSATVDLHFRA